MVTDDDFLLTVDGFINLILGIVLLFMPLGLDHWLGLPVPVNYFYPIILGGVLVGIGIALFQERYGGRHNVRGLGINGAIVINFCGASVLILWLLFTNMKIPQRGLILLWTVALLVFGTGIVEIIAQIRKNKGHLSEDKKKRS